MRRVRLFTLLFAVAPLSVTAQQVDIGHATAKDVAVRLTGPFNQLKVIGWKYDSVSVTGFMPKGFRLENVFAGDPGVPARGAKMYIDGPETMMPKGAILELRVPVNARVWIKGGTATLIVSGITGELDLNMIGGTITVDGKPRLLNIEAMDANIEVSALTEWMRLKTGAGNITMRGKSVDAAFNTVSGNVHVLEATLERANFESVTGSLTFAGDFAKGASLSFNTHSGAVDVQIPGKPDAAFDVVTMGGSIENQLSSRSATPGRNGLGKALEFELGFGNARIHIESYKGNVRLAPR